MTVEAAGRQLGAVTLGRPDSLTQFDFPLPADLTGTAEIDVAFSVDRPPGVRFGYAEIR